MLIWLGRMIKRLGRGAGALGSGAEAVGGDAFDGLMAELPSFARNAFVQQAELQGDRPGTPAALFDRLRSWANDAGIAEGRGGYPGGRDKPGWTDYVKLQQTHIAIYRALTDAFGPPAPGVAELFASYAQSFPAPVRRIGAGYEPHVDQIACRLIYSLPVDSGIVSSGFEFPISERDLQVLLHDSWRRGLLEVVAHTVLQRSMIRGNPEVTELEFSGIVEAILHSDPNSRDAFVQRVGREHQIGIEHYARLAQERPSGNDAEIIAGEGDGRG